MDTARELWGKLSSGLSSGLGFPDVALGFFGGGGGMGAGASKEKLLASLPESGERYFGLENFGNTCYANSVRPGIGHLIVQAVRQWHTAVTDGGS